MNFSGKKVKPKRLEKVIKSIIVLNIALDLIFLIARAILLNYGILFRNVILNSIWLNNVILVIAIVIYFNILIGKKSEITVFVTSLIGIILIPIILFYMFFMYAFLTNEESVCYQEGKRLVSVSYTGFHHSSVNFYEPINFAMMKSASFEGFGFEGAFNYYAYRGNGENLKNENIDVRSSYYFEELNPLAAKKKFSTDTFKYLGNHTYDFGDVEIKFDDTEKYVEEALIIRDVAFYDREDVDIIGQNIKDIENNIIKINDEHNEENNYNSTISFKERIIDGEKNILMFKESDYGTHLNEFTFVVDNNDVVRKIKFTTY